MTVSSIVIFKEQSLEEAREIIKDMLAFDCDWSGDNGDEYLIEEAEGFESNNDWLVSTLKEANLDAIEIVLKSFFEHNYSYYESDVEVKEFDKFYTLAIAWGVRN